VLCAQVCLPSPRVAARRAACGICDPRQRSLESLHPWRLPEPPQRIDWLWAHYRQCVRQPILEATPLTADLADVVAAFAFEERAGFMRDQEEAQAELDELLRERRECETTMGMRFSRAVNEEDWED